MVQTLREDFHFPLCWQPDNCGYKGNPYWSFYQPLSYLMVYFTSIFTSIFDKDYVFSGLKGAVFLSFLISEIGMFLLLRTMFKDSPTRNLVSVFGALIYLFAPYRYVDLYSRNAYSELWVFPWMPLYFLGFYKLFFLKEKKGAFIIAFMTPIMFFSHLIPSFFFIFIIHFAFLLFLMVKRNLFAFIVENKQLFLYWLSGNIVGAMVSLLYVLPAMNVVKYINGDFMGFDRVSLDNVLNHISWCSDMLDLSNFKGGWQVGQVYLISFGVLALVLLFKKNILDKNLSLYLIFSVLLTFAFLMSRTLWHYMPEVFYGLQFSWRLFLVYSFLCSLIVALLVNELNIKIPFLILILAFHFYTGERFLHYGGDDVTIANYNIESWLNSIYRQKFTTTNNYSAHSILPKTSDPIFFNFNHADETGSNEKYSNTFILNPKPGVNILSHKRLGNTFNYEILAENPAFLIFKQYYYYTWKLFIDSKPSKNLYLTEQGLIGIEVPKGRHKIVLRSN